MAAAVLQIFQLQPIVPQQELEFCGPGLRAGQIGEKGSGAGTGGAFIFTHGCCTCRLPLGVDIPGGVRDDVQFHAVVQFLLSGVFNFLHGVQRTQSFITVTLLYLDKPLSPCS
jgi:hypothetical protein